MKVAIIGAIGAVGREIINEIQRYFDPATQLSLFASQRSAGEELKVWGRSILVQKFEAAALKDIPFALMSAGGDFSRANTPQLLSGGTTVIDNSSAWRMDPRYQLVVPEVNGHLVESTTLPTVFPNGNCSTIQLVVVLAALHRAFGLRSVTVSSYQSVSGAGQKGIDDLSQQVRGWVSNEPIKAQHLPRSIAFDLIPAIDRLDAEGHCYEEVKIVQETRKILGIADLPVFATTVRVPTFRGHGESVMVDLDTKVSKEVVNEALLSAPSIRLHAGTDYETLPVLGDCVANSDVHVSRVRLPHGEKQSNRVMFWNISDNLYKGAASNAVQILDLIRRRKA
jgi:aspartate-semialdehyde dehydrogenase